MGCRRNGAVACEEQKNPKSLILDCADFAMGKIDAAPPELIKGQWCDRYKTLPRLVGMDEQDYGDMLRMAVAVNVYEAFSSMASAGNKADWGNANPGAAAIVLEVRAMRQADNGK